MSIAVKEAAELYDFLIRVFGDIKSAVFHNKNEMFRVYGQMFDAVQYIHYDYTKMMLDLQGSLLEEGDAGSVEAAKSHFLQARKRFAPERSVHKSEAKQYLERSSDLVEARFLFSVFIFLYYYDSDNNPLSNMTSLDLSLYFALTDNNGGDGSLNSASSSLWLQIQEEKDKASIRKKALQMKNVIDERYSMVSTCYRDLESQWKYGHPAIKGGVDKMLRCIGVIEKRRVLGELIHIEPVDVEADSDSKRS